ncbi:MAG: hypothetical protein LUD39_04370 [Opitutae bacterium]|nr:hypothetical protein [Opitutae bacterium]
MFVERRLTLLPATNPILTTNPSEKILTTKPPPPTQKKALRRLLPKSLILRSLMNTRIY